MEKRMGKITASKAGGTAARGSKTYKLSLPSAWVSELGLSGEDGRVVLSFDGESITLRPRESMEQYRKGRLSRGHGLMEIRYYDGNELCTLIYADKTEKDIRAENYTEDFVKTAFGRKEHPTWADLEEFLEERCVPRDRAGLREYLEALGVEEYDPLAVILKTKGRMAEDDQWMEVRDIK